MKTIIRPLLAVISLGTALAVSGAYARADAPIVDVLMGTVAFKNTASPQPVPPGYVPFVLGSPAPYTGSATTTYRFDLPIEATGLPIVVNGGTTYLDLHCQLTATKDDFSPAKSLGEADAYFTPRADGSYNQAALVSVPVTSTQKPVQYRCELSAFAYFGPNGSTPIASPIAFGQDIAPQIGTFQTLADARIIDTGSLIGRGTAMAVTHPIISAQTMPGPAATVAPHSVTGFGPVEFRVHLELEHIPTTFDGQPVQLSVNCYVYNAAAQAMGTNYQSIILGGTGTWIGNVHVPVTPQIDYGNTSPKSWACKLYASTAGAVNQAVFAPGSKLSLTGNL